MKTLTEFSGFTLKEALAKKSALIAEGKSEDEALSAVHEQLKLDEAKAGFYKNVVDMTSSRIDRVKRVVVALKATETEKVPESYMEREGHFYLVEYFPTADSRARMGSSDRDDRGGRGGRGNDRNSRGRGGNDRGERSDRGMRSDRGERGPGRESRPPRPEGGATSASIIVNPVDPTKAARPQGDRKRPSRGPRPERKERSPGAPREARGPRGPKGAGELRLVLKGQSATTLQGSAPKTEATSAPANPEQQQA
jgi:hypothetical protein